MAPKATPKNKIKMHLCLAWSLYNSKQHKTLTPVTFIK